MLRYEKSPAVPSDISHSRASPNGFRSSFSPLLRIRSASSRTATMSRFSGVT